MDKQKLRALLDGFSINSEETDWSGTHPNGIAIIFMGTKRGSQIGQCALVSCEFPLSHADMDYFYEQFSGPEWRLAGYVISYPQGSGTAFQAHPDPEFGQEAWEQMLGVPVFDSECKSTGLTYRDKIHCRLLNVDYATYLATPRPGNRKQSQDGLRLPDPKHRCSGKHGFPNV